MQLKDTCSSRCVRSAIAPPISWPATEGASSSQASISSASIRDWAEIETPSPSLRLAEPEQVEDVDGEPVCEPHGDIAPDIGAGRRTVNQDQGLPIAEHIVGDLAPREREASPEVPGYRHQITCL